MTKDFKEYIQNNRDGILDDIGRLVGVRSVKAAPEPGAPYGRAVKDVMELAMSICQEYGFDEVVNLQDRIAYAHYGDPDRFIAVAAHLDVVPEGGGWQSDPFEMSIKDGYMVGRGVCDDKGPFVLALWAIKYIIDSGVNLNYGIRLIIGLDEESGMSDIEYYNRHYQQALFAFTPDAGFPVCHGEKGLYQCDIISPVIPDGNMLALSGGLAHNVVPDSCIAEFSLKHAGQLKKAVVGRDDILLTPGQETILVQAKGVASHASVPERSVNAILVLFRFLLETGVLTETERLYMEFLASRMEATDGSQYGIQCEDGLFTPLTLISGLVRLEKGQLILSHDCRYPTVINGEEITARIEQRCLDNGFTVGSVDYSKPFYISPDSPAIQLLCDIYNKRAGTQDKPFVVSGGTYARYLDNAVSYGIEIEGTQHPDWVGNVHMKNEALRIDQAVMSCEVFIEALLELQKISFEN